MVQQSCTHHLSVVISQLEVDITSEQGVHYICNLEATYALTTQFNLRWLQLLVLNLNFKDYKFFSAGVHVSKYFLSF